MKVTKYNHHGVEVYTNKETMGKHREFCLCFQCSKLNIEERQKNCPIANAIYDNCVKFNLTTPVFECPVFEEKEK